MPHDGAHGEVAEAVDDVAVSVRIIHHLQSPPAEATHAVEDVLGEGVKCAPDACQRRELGVGCVLVLAEVVRHAARGEDGDVPVGSVPGDGGETVVTHGTEEDMRLASTVVVESGDGSGDGVTAGVGVDDVEGKTGKEAPGADPVDGVLHCRDRLHQREQARVVGRENHGDVHLIGAATRRQRRQHERQETETRHPRADGRSR